MRIRNTLVWTAGLALATACVGFATAQDAAPAPAKEKVKKIAKIGEAAPNFTLKDATGKEYKLSDYQGKTVVLQWINPDCPVCKRVSASGLAADMVKDLKKIDANVVHLAINSTHYMEGAKSASYLKQYKLEAPGLIDQDGTVGHMYGARTTPHMFVIDGKGVLRYSGAIDDDRRGDKGKNATNYVINAVRQIAAGETVAPDSTRPYGCSVKYAGAGGKGKGRRGGRRGGA